VVGFAVGTAGDVEGVGAGVTVCTDGPALVSFAVGVGLWGRTIANTATARATAIRIGIQSPYREGGPTLVGSFGSRRGSRGLLKVMVFLRSFPAELPAC
jgi:hypothetical protein